MSRRTSSSKREKETALLEASTAAAEIRQTCLGVETRHRLLEWRPACWEELETRLQSHLLCPVVTFPSSMPAQALLGCARIPMRN